MTEIHVSQMPMFKRVYKKLHFKEQVIVDDAIQEIVKNPKLGESKKGDLNGIFVYKFKVNQQEMLLVPRQHSILG